MASKLLPPPDPSRPFARATRSAAQAPAEALAEMRNFQAPKASDPKAWARRLRAREIACEDLSMFQRAAWREALHEPASARPDSRPESDPPYESKT
jgi:hypothetical protein